MVCERMVIRSSPAAVDADVGRRPGAEIVVVGGGVDDEGVVPRTAQEHRVEALVDVGEALGQVVAVAEVDGAVDGQAAHGVVPGAAQEGEHAVQRTVVQGEEVVARTTDGGAVVDGAEAPVAEAEGVVPRTAVGDDIGAHGDPDLVVARVAEDGVAVAPDVDGVAAVSGEDVRAGQPAGGQAGAASVEPPPDCRSAPGRLMLSSPSPP